MLRARLVASGASLALIVAGWLCFDLPHARRAASAPMPHSAALERRGAALPDRSSAAPTGQPARATSDESRRPASLAGSDVDGDLVVDPDGRFVPGPEALRLFDYFLSAIGEEPLAQIRARIVDEISRRLSGDAAGEAVALLDRYLAYRDAAERFAMAGGAPAELDQRMQWLRELRREHFGPELAATLFGDEEEVALIDLEKRRLWSEEDLSDPERVARIEELESRLPLAEREARRASAEPARIHQQVEALRAAGADPHEIDDLREQAFGREASERLAALDQQRAVWQERLARYAAERDAIRADASLSDATRREAVDALRARSFEGPERLRVRILLDEAL